MKPITIPKVNLSASEASHYLNVSKSDLDVSRLTGKFRGVTPPPFIRLGRSVRYRIKDLDQWLESQPAFTSNAQEMVG
ncbi:helix-turn-helix transcriptional regulator [Endozoicomonas euniceicola]|uniref:Helix-turn-helix domain-containing protein n=1 Tax=Endozoicomonas euniceicola TaxID=1234143 RepID=A0ABY6GMV6_9GAMM|nr:helix-turn-helix domain-containing protein [Endozoicomonas euniceicola]UYM14052.1 helix-turn-helix domain-containing protein [Endozoicomonas euniceicola]